jgi:lysophospholipase L1-like esterase
MRKTALLLCTVLVCAAMTTVEKPSIFLIGDSISVQYWPYLRAYLSDIAVIERKKDDGQAEKNLDVPTGSNGGDSRMVLGYLRARYSNPAFRPNYLLLNCGLHDVKHDPATGIIQVTEEDYRKNLNEIVALSEKNHTKLIWIRTTYVVDSIHNAKSSSIRRYGDDVIRYNAIADEVMAQHRIKSIDLYSFSKLQGIEHIADHVHYDLPTRALQAAYIAGFIEREVKNEK